MRLSPKLKTITIPRLVTKPISLTNWHLSKKLNSALYCTTRTLRRGQGILECLRVDEVSELSYYHHRDSFLFRY